MSYTTQLVEVSIFDMSEWELLREAEDRRAAGETQHADELLAFTALRGRAVASYPTLPVQQAMERRYAEETAEARA